MQSYGKVEVRRDTDQKHRNTNFIPAEKLTTGKKRPSMLKFSNIPWTGCPLIRNEMLGALRSKQQLMTSSVFNRCWFGELTVRAIQPKEGKTWKEMCVYLRKSSSEPNSEFGMGPDKLMHNTEQNRISLECKSCHMLSPLPPLKKSCFQEPCCYFCHKMDLLIYSNFCM